MTLIRLPAPAPPGYEPNPVFGEEFEKVGLVLSGWNLIRRCMTTLAYYYDATTGTHHYLRAPTHFLDAASDAVPSNEVFQRVARGHGDKATVGFHDKYAAKFGRCVQLLTTERSWQKLEVEKALTRWPHRAAFFEALYARKADQGSDFRLRAALRDLPGNPRIPVELRDALEDRIRIMVPQLDKDLADEISMLKHYLHTDNSMLGQLGDVAAASELELEGLRISTLPPASDRLLYNYLHKTFWFSPHLITDGLLKAQTP